MSDLETSDGHAPVPPSGQIDRDDGDLGYRLWDPDKRRQPPGEKKE